MFSDGYHVKQHIFLVKYIEVASRKCVLYECYHQVWIVTCSSVGTENCGPIAQNTPTDCDK